MSEMKKFNNSEIEIIDIEDDVIATSITEPYESPVETDPEEII